MLLNTRAFVIISLSASEAPMIGKVKLPLCSTNLALRHEGVWGSGLMLVNKMNFLLNMRKDV